MAWLWSSKAVSTAVLVSFAIIANGVLMPVTAITDPKEIRALLAFKASLQDTDNNLKTWTETSDPCDDPPWKGVACFPPDVPPTVSLGNDYSHVTDLRLLNFNLGGQFVDELADLPALAYLNVMFNHMEGGMPAAVGKLTNLKKLMINANNFSGPIPSDIGNLQKLTVFQIDFNHFSGQLPDSLANLTAIKHLHMNDNDFTGTVPPGLENLESLLHILLDNNQLSGPLPEGLVNSSTIEMIQLDNNTLPSVPAGYAAIPSLWKLSLRNCNMSGPLPRFSQSTKLRILDLSHNSLSGQIPISTLPPNLTEIDLSHNQLNGTIPDNVGNLQLLEFLGLSNNNFSGDIPSNLGTGASFTSTDGSGGAPPNVVLDFQNNSLSIAPGSTTLNINSASGRSEVWLSGNPKICPKNGPENPACKSRSIDSTINLTESWNGEPLYPDVHCSACKPPLMQAPAAQQSTCRCALPITLEYRLISPTFKFFHLNEDEFREHYLCASLHIANEQLNIVDYTYQVGPRIATTLQLFPPGRDRDFNHSEVQRLYTLFVDSNITFFNATNKVFGPAELLSFKFPEFIPSSRKQSMGVAAKVGIAVTACVLVGLGVVLFFVLRKRRLWQSKYMQKSRRGVVLTPLNVPGVRSFGFAEMVKATDGFNEKNLLGEGGYGKVYLGVLQNGQRVAVKRAEERSVQGQQEFENEIRTLSRVNHRHLVSLAGYCNDAGKNINGEQMLVYEYVSNGNLWDHLNPNVKVPLDIMTRMRIALGSARGLHYLHTQAMPPIFHRDIKAANILLDGNFDAKVSDFGLSKLAADSEADFEGGIKGYISTIVKGTLGYLDPEYVQTMQLTDKSDVYSFGVVLLQLMSGKPAFSMGQNLTREVNAAVHAGDTESIIDPLMGPYPMKTVDAVIQVALSCVHNERDARPSMTKVLNQLEDIWKSAPWPSTMSTKARSELSGSIDSRELHGFSKTLGVDDFKPSDRLLGKGSFSGQFARARDTSISESELVSGNIMTVLPR